MNVSEKISAGIHLHLGGQLQAAEGLYKEVLAEEPDHPDAHNLLAHVYHRRGEHLKALYHVNQAISRVRNAQFLNTRGIVFIGMGRMQEAVTDLRAALKLEPHLGDAHSNLAIAYRKLGEYRKAVEHGKRSVDLMPANGDAWLNLGVAQQDSGQYDEALASYRRALEVAPHAVMALANMARLTYMRGDFEQAATTFRAAYRMGGDGLDMRFAHAHALIELGRKEEAAEVLEEGLGALSDLSGMPGVVVQDPFIKTLSVIGSYLGSVISQPARAVNIYETCVRALGTPPPASAAPLLNNLGTIYFNWHRIPDAIRSYEDALKASPTLAWAYNNLGVCYATQKESLAAIGSFNAALSIDPNHPAALGWLLREKTEICDWENFADVRARVRGLRNTSNTMPISPFAALSVFDDPQDLLYWASLSANEMFNQVAGCTPAALPQARRKRKAIRIGYLSFDFRNHPVAHLTGRLFELHDKKAFHVYIYSYGPDDGSEARRRVQNAAKHFVDLKDMSLAEMAARIAEDDIDFLIDLTGNTQHNRSAVLGLRPARLQAHWLGFIGTMGSSHYDYILADDFVAPPGSEGDFAEKILRLPGGMHVMDETRTVDAARQTRAGNGLPEEAVVFGSFCQSFKIQPEMFARWMDILKQVPGSVLWLASGPQGMEENLRRTMAGHGVEPSRLIIAQRCGVADYLARFPLMDLFLDTFPYTSGTVASDALLAGCPVLTMTGRTMVSRMAGSILNHANMGELVTASYDEYVANAVRLGRDREERGALRDRLAAAKATAPLFDMPLAVRGLEQAVKSVIES